MIYSFDLDFVSAAKAKNKKKTMLDLLRMSMVSQQPRLREIKSPAQVKVMAILESKRLRKQGYRSARGMFDWLAIIRKACLSWLYESETQVVDFRICQIYGEKNKITIHIEEVTKC